jgi:hypothetical protein
MISNLDANGLSHNPSPLQEDLARAQWHGILDQMHGWQILHIGMDG